jgi:hypothetical protein
MKRLIIILFVLALNMPAWAERWLYTSQIGRAIPDATVEFIDSAGVSDSIFIPIHASISDINFYLGITTYGGGDQLMIDVRSSSGHMVYLSNWWTRVEPQPFYDCWYDTQDIEDGPGDLDDYVNTDAYGWWRIHAFDISAGGVCTFNLWRIELYGTNTGIVNLLGVTPDNYYLDNPFPNPFNSSIVVKYGLPTDSYITIDIYDILGRLIQTPVKGVYPAGSYQLKWDGADYPTGVYFIKMASASFTQIQKAVLIK